MSKMKSTKRALLMSALAIVMCLSMLIGSTFAWFTDSVTSGRNTIQSGNLDVKLEYSVLENGTWTSYAEVNDQTDIFGYDYWEPGYVAVAKFKVTNQGSLALKYQLTADVYEEIPGVNVAGETFYLSNFLYTEVVDVDATREEILASTTGKRLKTPVNGVVNTDLTIKASNLNAKNDYDEVAMAIWMPTTVGNEANHNGTVPSITFGINLLATQQTYEEDSFDNQYDKDATYTISVNSTNELVSSFENMTEATVFDATGVSLNIDTIGTTTDEIIVPTFSIPTGATVKGAEFKIESNSMISAEATAVSDTVVFDECDIVTADADVTDGMPAMAIVGEMGTSVSSTKYVFNNCTFESYIMLNGINAEFNNCTFVLSNENDGATYCSFGEYVFNNCTFNYENGTNLIASNTIYADSYATVVLNDCTLVGATYGNSAGSTITVE